MVHPGQRIREVDNNRILVMGTWKAYVFFISRFIAISDISWPNKLVAGSGKTVLWYVLPRVREFAALLCCELARL